MEHAPDDILRLVFKAYVHDVGLSPANILTVSRRWNSLLLSMSSLWIRVVIRVTHYDNIPHIMHIGPNQASQYTPVSSLYTQILVYLKRSIPPDNPRGLPLDISIKCILNDNQPQPTNSKILALHVQQLLDCVAGKQMTVKFSSLQGASSLQRLDEDIASRWRSLEIDIENRIWTKIGCLRLNFGNLRQYGHITLSSLQSLVLTGVDMDLDNIIIPNLNNLSLTSSGIRPFPNLSPVKHLTARGWRGHLGPTINWEQCGCLRALHLDYLWAYTTPTTHNFPHLTTIRLEYLTSTCLGHLSSIFNTSRPLKRLYLTANGLDDITRCFEQEPNFCLQELRISSWRLKSRPSNVEWDRSRYGNLTWELEKADVVHACELLQVLRSGRGISVAGEDAQMDAILHEAEIRLRRRSL